MNPAHLWQIFRAHYKPALIVFVLTIAGGIGFTLWAPKLYTTTTALVFDIKQDPIAGIPPTMLGYMATQVEVMKSDRVAQRVVRMLKLNEHAGLKQQWIDTTEGKIKLELWIGELLQRGLQISPVAGSNIIEISYRAADPNFAMLVANAYAQAYIETNIELRVDPARQYSVWFTDQSKVMRENLEKAQTRLSEYQQKEGIVAKDEQVDAEMVKLTDLTNRLTAVQEQGADARSKQNSGADTLPEMMNNTVLSTLRSELLKAEAKLQEAASNLGKNHPQYERMEVEVAALRKQVEAETLRITRSFSSARSVSKDKESELKVALAAQKEKLLQLRSRRDQLAVLQRDVDAAQGAYEVVIKRLNQTSLESQVTQTNASVLNAAAEPLVPSSPNVKKNVAASVLGGLILGFAVIWLIEFLDRRVRTAEDLADMLQLPVLGVIERPRQQPRLVLLRRLALPAPK